MFLQEIAYLVTQFQCLNFFCFPHFKMTGGRHVGYLHSLKFRNRYWAGRHLGFHLKIKKWCVVLLKLMIGSCTKNFNAIIWNRSWTAGIKRKSKMAAAGRHLGFHLKIKKWCVELLIFIIRSCTKNFTQLSETVPELQALKENPRWRPAAILDFIWKSKNDMWNCWYL